MILIDAANVIGSRPDGWWRDRPQAARRFVDELRAAAAAGKLPGPVIVVLEGASRRGATEGGDGGDGVEIVHAAGSGDDALIEIAAQAAEPVLVVTADRELVRRTRNLGAEVVGPKWLVNRLTS
jgi:hypothetical protein